MWNGIDRRKFPRAIYKCLITIKKRLAPKVISTHTENIGSGGICVLIKEDLGLFQGVDLEIYLDDGDTPVRCGGTIVWVVKKATPRQKRQDVLYDTGIEFIDVRPADQDRIATIVESILEKRARFPR